MGKFPQSLYQTDTETDNTSSSGENLKKKRKPSILKYTSTSAKKKKCKIHSVSEPDDSDHRCRSVSRGRNGHKKLQGILKHTGREEREEKERYYSSSEDDEEDDFKTSLPPDKFLVGRVPLPAGSKPGRGGGVALLVRKSVKTEQYTFLSSHFNDVSHTIHWLAGRDLSLENMQPKQTSSSSKKSSRGKRVTRKRSF